MLPGSGNRPRYIPRRELETPRGYGRREEYEGGERSEGKGEKCQFADVLKAPLGRDCPLSFSPSYSSLLWMLLGVSCSLPRVCLVLPLLSLIRGL
jgi:hypothetical protein